jgi:hypothetical protein
MNHRLGPIQGDGYLQGKQSALSVRARRPGAVSVRESSISTLNQIGEDVSLRGFLAQHPQRSHGRITPIPSDAYLAAPLVETCWRNSNEERPMNASRNEQDLYPTMNHSDQPPHNFNVSGLRGGPGVVSRTMVEIAPGLNVRLRGAEETRDCIGLFFFMPCTCLGCSQELCCIQDAAFVLCPACRVVSPLDNTGCCSEESNSTFSSTTTGFQHQGGVGLGFTFDNLTKWQPEIIQRRQSQFGNCLQ